MQCCTCERKSFAAACSGRAGEQPEAGKGKAQWMMTAAARSEKLPIRLMADAPRKMRRSLGERAVLVCVWVMYQERAAPTNDALLGSLFLSVAAKRSQAVGTRREADAAAAVRSVCINEPLRE
jgi:hypothetical protein